MGLDANGTRLLLYASTLGVDYSRTATIGRQKMNLSKRRLTANLREFGREADQAAAVLAGASGYAEPFLRLLGADEIRSFDASAYEGATDVHDFNQPLADDAKRSFTAVIDGGSLEHVFNFPQAIANAMDLVAQGGHFVGVSPTNNFSGHGFYQFSAELFCRVFTEENGFEISRLVMFKDFWAARWFEVIDPARLRERVTIVNSTPTYLGVVARRVSVQPIFATWPQQSDYAAQWSGGTRQLSLLQRLASTRAGEWLYRALPPRSRDLFINRRRMFRPLRPRPKD
ncbi:MAG: hypothetical protein ACYC7A_08335 [Thermoanaerobaculia bacterium]